MAKRNSSDAPAAAGAASNQMATGTAAAPAPNPGNLPAAPAGNGAGDGATSALAQRIKGLPPATASKYAIVQMADADDQDAKDLQEAMLANLGDGGQLSAFDFDRIRVPAGGGVSWELVDSATGGVSALMEFEGIPVSWQDQKSYWEKGIDEGGERKPPDCFSTDLVQGIGNPGIACATCPNNTFGSAKGGKGKGKACKDSRMLFVMRENSLMPDLVIAPPTSLKDVKRYFKFLMSRGIPYYRAITRFTLERQNQQPPYSIIKCQLVGVLPPAEFAITRSFSNKLSTMLGRSQIAVRIEDLTGGTAETTNGNEPVAGAGAVDDVVEGSSTPAAAAAASDDRSL